MRGEGVEVGVGRPQVIEKEVDGVMMEPYEAVLIDCEDQHQGSSWKKWAAVRLT